MSYVRNEFGRIVDEGSGIDAPADDCHCKKYGHDDACTYGLRCLCAYCESARFYAEKERV
jgi:hypothetical protein